MVCPEDAVGSERAGVMGEAPTDTPYECNVFLLDHTSAIGGAETFLLRALHLLQRRCRSVTVVLAQEGELADRIRAIGGRVSVVPLDPAVLTLGKHHGPRQILRAIVAAGSLVVATIRLAWIFRNCPNAVVYTYSLKADIYGSLAARIARVPCVWQMHDLMSPEMFPWPYRRLLTAIANRLAVTVLCNSGATRDAMIAAGLRPERATLRHYGVPIEAPPRLRVERARAAFGATERPVIGLIGRIAPWKGQHVLVEAAPAVLRAAPNALFLLVGAAAFGTIDTDYETLLRERIAQLGLEEQVLLTGHRDDVPEVMAACDIVVHTSVKPEAFGLVVTEAMALAKPVLASRCGGVPEIIEDGVTGRLLQPDDPTALAEAIVYYLQHREAAARMGEAARRAVRDRFSIEAAVAGIAAALDRAVSEWAG